MDEVSPIFEIPLLKARPYTSHKGTYGKVLVIAGSRNMAGAAILCGIGALRAGAGLVQVASPAPVQPTVAAGFPSYTTLGIPVDPEGKIASDALTDVISWAGSATALAIGPGLGQGEDVNRLVRGVLPATPSIPGVVDADGLNAIAPFGASAEAILSSRKAQHATPAPLILTPHPGEFARLSGASREDIAARRESLAVSFARQFGVILVLKGAGTVVTDGQRLYQNMTGNPGLATGGSGDVLTGVIAGLLAQGLTPWDAAVLGVWVHGRAGDLAAQALGQTALTSTDLLHYLSAAFRERE